MAEDFLIVRRCQESEIGVSTTFTDTIEGTPSG